MNRGKILYVLKISVDLCKSDSRACPVELTCDSGVYSFGVGRNYRTGVSQKFLNNRKIMKLYL